MKRIAIIPARAGSKRLPRKNVLPLRGRPLICWTLDVATGCGLFDLIVVSTDDPDVVMLCKDYNVFVHHRGDSLSSDTATSTDVVLDVLIYQEKVLGNYFDVGVLLQPTSPLRIIDDVKRAVFCLEKENMSSVATFSESSEHIHLMSTFEYGLGLETFYKRARALPTRSQDFVKSYILNGAIYVFNIEKFLKEKTFFLSPGMACLMEKENSIDIDDKRDLEYCEEILSNE